MDVFSVDEAAGSVRLFTAYCKGAGAAGSLTHTNAKSWSTRLQTFCEDSFSGKLVRESEESAPAYGLVTLLNQTRGGSTRLRLYLLADSIISSRIGDLPKVSVLVLTTGSHIWYCATSFVVFES